MSEKIDRRKFLTGAGAGSLLVLPLGGCTTGGKDAASAGRPHYVMVFDQNKCVGCGDCKKACNETNKLPKGVSRLLLELSNSTLQGKGYQKDRKYIRVSCQQCQNAPCVKVCPTGAAHYDAKTGIVTMDRSKCVGCKYCIVACPYNVRYINSETKVADNCNFCLDTRLSKNQEPGCVEACKYNALVFGDINDKASYVNKLLAVKDSVRIKPHLGTDPSLRYIPIVKKGV
ncbi:MAG: 4Fe-4S binding protein [Duodenibacillus sp.]|nr:4Fe-4S binding protein [Duodenibacillus sp.]